MDIDIEFSPIKVETALGTFEVVLVEGDVEGDLEPAVSPLAASLLGQPCAIHLQAAPGIRTQRVRRGLGYGLDSTIKFTHLGDLRGGIGEVEVEYGRVKTSYASVDEGEGPEETPVEVAMRNAVETLFADPAFEDRMNQAIAGAEKASTRWRSGQLKRQAEELAREASAIEAEADDIYAGPGM